MTSIPGATGPRRREFRNIHVTQLKNYRLPPAGISSILHRASGALLFLALPLLLWLFDLSLTSELSYARLAGIFGFPFVKLVVLLLAWALLHHLLSGIRHLLLDMHIGLDKRYVQQGALIGMALTGLLTLVAALKIFGVF
jgi:succinate dehydrogenase / fumarate reductase cytochrome b subunit